MIPGRYVAPDATLMVALITAISVLEAFAERVSVLIAVVKATPSVQSIDPNASTLGAALIATGSTTEVVPSVVLTCQPALVSRCDDRLARLT